MHKVFVVGSLNIDMVMKAEKRPRKGETISGSYFYMNGGGKGANQAVAAKKSGGDVQFCACVGKDVFGERLLEGLAQYGIDCKNVRRMDGVMSGLAQITVVGGDNSIILYCGANGCVDEAQVDAFLRDAAEGDVLLVALEIPIQTVLFALKTGKTKDMITILNPAPAQHFCEEMLNYTDILIPNETEAATIVGVAEIEVAIQVLSQKTKNLIVTLGEKGCFSCFGEVKKHHRCPQVKVVDTTAAGDTFCGALAARLANGDEMRDAIEYALKAACLTVTRAGAQQSIPDEIEVLSTF